MLTVAVLFLAFARSAWSQTCSVATIGPCVGTTCPAGNTCLTNLSPPACCPDANVVTTTSTTTTTASTTTVPTTTTTAAVTNCVDLLNPSTGVSDCPATAYLCNNAVYYTLMTQQCPRTCGRCPASVTTTVPSATCVDLLNPQTGVSDCPSRANLCSNSVYYTLMTQQCPRTCGRCSGVATTTATSATCVDLLNPQTGVSDCPARANLCNNSAYYTLMTQQCPRTCSRCSGSVVTTTVANTNCLDLLNPQTGVSDCPSRASLCNNSVYYSLMTQQCPRTCGRCASG